MNKQEIIDKIMKRKEYSGIPKKDVEMAFANFDSEKYSDTEKIKLTRDLLRKVYSGFASRKIFSLKNKPEEWILRKHLSTRERLPYYDEIYSRLLKDFDDEIMVFDLGAGINGFSYKYMKKFNPKIKYIGIEAIGHFVELMNYYFAKNSSQVQNFGATKSRNVLAHKTNKDFVSKKENLNAKAIHLSLFELEKVKQIIKKENKKKIVFLFKTLDSLEMLKKDYSKKLISEISDFVDEIVVSFSTRSMKKRKKFFVDRKWFFNFIKKNFIILDNFEFNGEKYICFKSSFQSKKRRCPE